MIYSLLNWYCSTKRPHVAVMTPVGMSTNCLLRVWRSKDVCSCWKLTVAASVSSPSSCSMHSVQLHSSSSFSRCAAWTDTRYFVSMHSVLQAVKSHNSRDYPYFSCLQGLKSASKNDLCQMHDAPCESFTSKAVQQVQAQSCLRQYCLSYWSSDWVCNLTSAWLMNH